MISGIDKQLVGQVAGQVRAVPPPEPYKGKGVRHRDEVIVLKDEEEVTTAMSAKIFHACAAHARPA